MKENPPNLVYIHSHDTGRYVQPYGHAIPTPHLQQFAEEGVLFRQAHCAAPTCSPSRAALLTGQSAHNSGMLGLAHRGFVLRDYSQMLSHVLRDAGYCTVLAGGQHVAAEPFVNPAEVLGYEKIFSHSNDEEVTANACNFLKSSQRPFFLDVGYFYTHRRSGVFVDPPHHRGDSRYVRPPAPLPDTAETRRDMADFMAAALCLDQQIGQVLAALEQSGQAENTLVICTTDHGIAFPNMKCSLTDHGTGVMLIVRGPGFRGGKVVDGLVSQIDLFPTICEVLDIEKPHWLQGKSVLPLLEGTAEINEVIFSEVSYHAAYQPQRAVRTNRWKYIRHFDGRHRPVLPNTDDSLSKTLWTDHHWVDRKVAEEELFDLLFDPAEANNLAADPVYSSVLKEMRQALVQWMEETNDPILQGEIPLPPGGVLTPVDAYSPSGR